MKQLLAFTGMFLSFHVFSQVPAHYISSIELNVREPSSELMNRSQQLVVSAFKKSIELSPHLRGKQFKTQTVGPEVIFTLTSDSDLQVPVQEILSSMVEGLNGRVLAHGKSLFYRAALTQPLGGYLEVVMDDSHKQILAISAESVPLRDVLNEIRNQSGSMSYLISGDCAEKLVDWSFGMVAPQEPKEIDAVMVELATLFNLNCEKKNGSFIFKGHCQEPRKNLMIPPRTTRTQPSLENVFFPTAFR
ncbi:MAG: hypothetical protein EB120_04025 [Proteobacteria bacterium]|nr:hypothetical protein [Pseudomonadota bacterium]NDG26328.1 hypothetical protein [Pseudomonadota bacterium]